MNTTTTLMIAIGAAIAMAMVVALLSNSASRATSGSPAPCPGTDFVRYPDRAFMGAKRPHRAASECACSNACRGDSECSGYQYDGAVPAPYPNCYEAVPDGSMPLMVPSAGGVAGLRIR